MNKIFALLDLFTKGKSVANPEAWKNGQISTNVLAPVVVATAAVAASFGIPVPVSPDDLVLVTAGFLSIFNTVMTIITSEKVGVAVKE